jgi:hypothetical protein
MAPFMTVEMQRQLLKFLSLLTVWSEQFMMFCDFIKITVRPGILSLAAGVVHVFSTKAMSNIYMLCYKPILHYIWMNCRSSFFLHETEMHVSIIILSHTI